MTPTARQLSTKRKYPTELRRLRLSYGLQVGRVAKEIDIDPSFLSLLERGLRQPSLAVAKRIAMFYEKPVEEVFPK